MDLNKLSQIPSWEWPPEADGIILEFLSDDSIDEADRTLAVHLAGDVTVINDKLANKLLSILRDNRCPEELRGHAAISLGPTLEHAALDGFEDPEDVLISEDTFHKVQEAFRNLYFDAETPKEVRRRILEASVRAPQKWHKDAVRAAYSSDDTQWQTTAVFSMRWVTGFDKQILEALKSENPDIHYEAVCAAGEAELDAAWSHVSSLLESKKIDKPLLLAAIEAVSMIRPEEAGNVLVDLTDSDDEDIVEAAFEAMAMADAISGEGVDDFEDNDGFAK